MKLRNAIFSFAAALLLVVGSYVPGSAAEKAAPYKDSIQTEKIQFNNPDFIRGMDVSSVVSLENAGVTFRNEKGEGQDIFKILADSGVKMLSEEDIAGM